MNIKPLKNISEPETNYVWVIAYINMEYYDNIDKLIARSKLDVEVNIPCITFIKKKFKGFNYREKVPLLFYYGFLKVRMEQAKDLELMDRIKSKLPFITGFLRHNWADFKVALVNYSEIERLNNIANKFCIYSVEDIDKLDTGMFITLHGYPFDNLSGTVMAVEPKQSSIWLRLSDTGQMVKVKFDNVFYSVYKNFDESLSRDSYDDGIPTHGIDKIFKVKEEDING